jgi:transposase
MPRCVAGQRDAKALARRRHRCVKASGHDIVRLFVLEQALAVYDDLAKRLHENSSRPDPEPRIGRVDCL